MATLLSITPRIQEENPKAGFSQSAIVVLYSTYLIASAISSEPPGINNCGPELHNSNTETSTVLLGSFFTFVALAYSTSSTATQHSSFSREDTPLLTQDSQEYIDDEAVGVVYNYSFFHFIFIIGSMYLAMLLTNVNFNIFNILVEYYILYD